MIEIVKLKDGIGAERFGSCVSCNEYDENNDFVRIKFKTGSYGTSICLCPQCENLLLRILEQEGGAE